MFFFLLLTCLVWCDGAKILGVFNHPGASHTFLGKILLKSLAEKGHEVVMISSFPMNKPIGNYKDIPLPELLEDLQRRDKMYFNKDKRNEIEELRNMSLQHTEDTFKNPKVQELLQSKQSFDVIIMDWFFNEATLIFSHIYKAPVIYLSSFGNMALLNDFTGNNLPISYVPGAGILMTDDMSFKHRTIMALFHVLYNFIYIPRRNKAHHEILKRHFDNPPTIEELQENVALVLSNSHFSFETPRPYTPNIIPIGGFHIQNLTKLPQDLKTFLDEAQTGVIYFSLGSQIKATNLNKTLFSSIVEAFSQVPQKVLWKFEGDDLIDLPDNIKISSWIPQLEVLGHPNVKLFITHGGILSTIEAIYFGVPLICLPFNGDQNTNAAFIESRKIGLQISPDEITAVTLLKMIREVILEPRYQQEVNYRSSLLREQPIKPLDAAMYWVEHVIQYGHGIHLKTFATKLPWYKYYLLDVIGLFLLILLIFLKFVLFVLRRLHKAVSKWINTSGKAKTS